MRKEVGKKMFLTVLRKLEREVGRRMRARGRDCGPEWKRQERQRENRQGQGRGMGHDIPTGVGQVESERLLLLNLLTIILDVFLVGTGVSGICSRSTSEQRFSLRCFAVSSTFGGILVFRPSKSRSLAFGVECPTDGNELGKCERQENTTQHRIHEDQPAVLLGAKGKDVGCVEL